jgi:MOSC domain-containing protein YiiM
MSRVGIVVSVNIAQPIPVMHGDKEVQTGIFKTPAGKPLHLSRTGLAGDGQADLINHGGEDKAVCVYSADHYPYWERELDKPVVAGAFGENFTVSDFTEESLCIGDILRVGEAVVQVSQPRQPCFKLGLKHRMPELPLHVQQTGFTGFYFRVLQEGIVKDGDGLYMERRHSAAVTVAEANRLKYTDKSDIEGIKRLLAVAELSASWRESFENRLAELEGKK